MKFLFITDPPAYPSPDNEVTVSYRRAARDGRFEFYHLPTAHVTGADEVLVAPVEADLTHETFLTLNERATLPMPIDAFDITFCRSRKPFPAGYLKRLDKWTARTRFLNNPLSKIEQTAAGFLTRVVPPEYLPEMSITGELAEIRAFLDRHGEIVAKRPGSTAGIGVYKLWRRAGAVYTDHVLEGERCHASLAAAVGHIQVAPDQSLELVRFLPGVEEGDRRAMVIDGELRGCFLRRSRAGHWVHNTSSAPVDCMVTSLTEHETRAIAATVPAFQRRGLRILGFDFLRDDDGLWKISEVNAGNVGGMGRLELITGRPYMTEFLTWMLEFARRASGEANPTLKDHMAPAEAAA